MLEQITSIFTTERNLILTLSFFTTVIVVYSIFIFYFYQFLARKNILELDLKQYNQYPNATLGKFLVVIFYIIEYIILLPILTFFWFGILSILILFLAKEMELGTILLLAAALVASVRVTSYISEDLSKELAKMTPFTLLAIAITIPGFFDVTIFFDRIAEIPNLFYEVPYYLLFIAGIELIMRIAELISQTLIIPEEKD